MSWNFKLVDGPYGGTTEGPAWDGSGLLFTHIPASRIMRYNPKTKHSTIYHSNTRNANGLMLDLQGRLYACEGGSRRVVRYEHDGSATILVDTFESKRLNIPNDLAIDTKGRVWFSDPYYEGSAGTWSESRASMELEHESVFRLDPKPDNSWSVNRVTFDTTRPNGLIFSLDYQILYVAESGRRPEEKRELRAYPLNTDGSLGRHTVLHDFGDYRGIDGMVLDTDGNIIATAGYRQGGLGPMVYIFSPTGDILEAHELPEDRPTNCSFGGPELQTLYVTTGEGHLFETETNRQGRLLFPALI